jgi:hypothetical protein
MDRTLFIVLCIAFIVVWMLGKRFLGKGKKVAQTPESETMRQVETWYGVAQEQVAFMEEAMRSKREEEWNGLSREERLQITDQFFTRHFGEKSVKLYNEEERLRVALAWYISSNH